MFSDPVTAEPDKIDDGFNTEKGSIICVNEVKENDAVAAPYDIDNDGKAEMLKAVKLIWYSSPISNYEKETT